MAQLFTDYLALGFEIERPGFPALNINKLAADDIASERYAQALHTHGSSADILLVVSAGQSSQSIVSLIKAAVDKDMSVVLLSAENDALLASHLGYNDVQINLGQFSGEIVTQAQFQVIQCICTLVDHQLFGGY